MKVDQNIAIFWFRRDLRLNDNAGLYQALKENPDVQPIFIFDITILEKLENKSDGRIDFIYRSLLLLKQELEEHGSSLLVFHADPVQLFRETLPRSVYANHDYEPYARQRDEAVRNIIEKNGGTFKTFKDQVIFDRDEILKDDKTPYTIFTPYSKKWKSTLTPFFIKSYPTERYFHRLARVAPLPFPSLEDIGFEQTNAQFPERTIKRSIIQKYESLRNYPAIHGTTRLSIHLRFGTVSIRKLVQLALKTNETWLNELIWREFYQMILWHFPHIEKKSFKPSYDRIEWRNDPEEFTAWCEGRTGYPIVDAGMRELNATGFMHNRVRMITASFLAKHLLIDWRWGEAYFAEKLLDYDLASNNGGWQWAAGSGCDAAPYFRVFSPELQTMKFDPEFKYIRKWVPKLDSGEYPKPIVDHKFARERALRVYSTALKRHN